MKVIHAVLALAIIGASVTACSGISTKTYGSQVAPSQAPAPPPVSTPTPALQVSCALGYFDSSTNSFIQADDKRWWIIGLYTYVDVPVQYNSPFQGTVAQADAQAVAFGNTLTGPADTETVGGPYDTKQQASAAISQARSRSSSLSGSVNAFNNINPQVQATATNNTSQSITASQVDVALYDHLGDELTNDITVPLNVLTIAPNVKITEYTTAIDGGLYDPGKIVDGGDPLDVWQSGTTCQATGTQ